MTNDDHRIEIEEARRHLASGQALLVCAYEDHAKCGQVEESISLAELQDRLPTLPKDHEILFICA
jgi:hypothetical protein